MSSAGRREVFFACCFPNGGQSERSTRTWNVRRLDLHKTNVSFYCSPARVHSVFAEWLKYAPFRIVFGHPSTSAKSRPANARYIYYNVIFRSPERRAFLGRRRRAPQRISQENAGDRFDPLENIKSPIMQIMLSEKNNAQSSPRHFYVAYILFCL